MTCSLFKTATITAILLFVSSQEAWSNDLETVKMLLLRAHESALKIENEPCCWIVASDIAKWQARAGDIQGALVTTGLLEDREEKYHAIFEIVSAQVRLGQVQEAIRTAQAVQDERAQGRALDAVASELAKLENFRDALGVALLIKDETSRATALESIAQEQAKAGDVPGALATAAAIPKDARNDVGVQVFIPSVEVLGRIARVRADAGDLITGLMIAARIKTGYIQGETMWAIAAGQADKGALEEAHAIAAAIENASTRACALEEVVIAQAKAKKWEGAIKAAHDIGKEVTCGWSDVKGGVSTASALGHIARIAVESGNGALSVKILEDANDDKTIAFVLEGIAMGQARADDIAGAQKTLSDPRVKWKERSLENIAYAQAKARNISGAIATSRQMDHELTKSRMIANILMLQAEQGEVKSAISAAVSFHQEFPHTGFLSNIARVQGKQGDFQGALQTISLIQDENEKPKAVFNAAGQYAKAGGKIEEALRRIESLKNPREKTFALLGMAVGLFAKITPVPAEEYWFWELAESSY